MADSDQPGAAPKSTGSFGSRRQFLTLAVVLVVAGTWVGSLFWVRSFSVTSQTSATAAPTLTVTTTAAMFITLTPEPAPTVTVTKPVQVAPMGVLGPTGVGKLHLGMSYTAALATGQVAKGTDPRYWFTWTVKDHPSAGLCLSKADGLTAIFADKSAVTPEGTHNGSTLAEVEAAYSTVAHSIDYDYIPITATTRYEFRTDAHNKVIELVLAERPGACFN